MSDPVTPLKAAVQISSDIVKIAKDNPDAQRAGTYAAKSLKIVAQTVHSALLPLAALNYGIEKFRDYMEAKFSDRLDEKLAEVPEDQIIPPKAYIAGPALQGLAFAHDQPNLEDMYLSLIASAMTARTAGDAHPAFVEVIKQLDAAETHVLNSASLGEGQSLNLRKGNIARTAFGARFGRSVGVVPTEIQPTSAASDA